MPIGERYRRRRARGQFSLWAQGSAEMFEPIRLRQVGAGAFHGRAEKFGLGAVKLLRLSSDPAFITRSPEMIRQSDPEWVQVMLQTGGRHVISQDERSTPVVDGDVVAWQSATPCTIDVRTSWRRPPCSRRDLADPALADRSIAAIATSNGCVSQAHFSRAFRATYGQPPSAMRGIRSTPG